MRKITLLICLLTLLFLFIHLQFSKPLEITYQNQISSLKDNQKVLISGKVISDSESAYSRTLKLNNNITLICKCKNLENLEGKNITAIGIIDTFQYGKINILKIRY